MSCRRSPASLESEPRDDPRPQKEEEERMKRNEKHVLVIYTGGTIGMVRNTDNGQWGGERPRFC